MRKLKDKFLSNNKAPTASNEARELAAAYLKAENERTGHEAYTPTIIGEILSGKRDFAPAVMIAQFILNRKA